MCGELFIRTQYDGHDYRSVLEIFCYDEDGEERIIEDLTAACQSISTCADQGTDTWTWIKGQVIHKLDSAGIMYANVYFADEEPETKET